MTPNVHWQHKVKRLKARAALAVVLLLALGLWMFVGWCCWTIIKSAP